jgi:hypothetical protein
MSTSGSQELALLDQARRLLAKANSLEEIMSFHDNMVGVQAAIKAAKLGLALLNQAAEAKLRAERKAGILLHSMHLRGGNRRSKGGPRPLKLEELGISRWESKHWQRVASVPERDFCEYCHTANELGEEATSAGLLRFAAPATAHHSTPAMNPENREKHSERDRSDELRVEHQKLLVEVVNDFGLMTNVLEPICHHHEMEFEAWQRHVVGRYLDEIGDKFRRLCAHIAHSSARDSTASMSPTAYCRTPFQRR